MFSSLSKHPKNLKWLLGISLSFILILALLPVIIKQVVINQLQKQGFETTIDNIDLNLFSGEFSLNSLQETTTTKNKLSLKKLYIEFDWLPLISHKIQINQVTIDGLKLKLKSNKESIIISNVAFPLNSNKTKQKPSNNSPWFISLVASELSDINIIYKDESLNFPITLNKISIKSVDTEHLEQQVSFALKANINQAKIDLTVKGNILSPNAIINTALKVESLPLNLFKNLSPKQIKLKDGLLNINSAIGVNLINQKPDMIKHDGTITLSKINLDFVQGIKNLNLQLNNLNITNNLSIDTQSPKQSIKALSNVQLDEVQLTSEQQSKIIINKLNIKQFKLNGLEQITVTEVLLKDIKLKEEKQKPPIYQNSLLSIKNIQLSHFNNLSIDNIEQKNQNININIDKNKQINIKKVLTQFNNAKKEDNNNIKQIEKFNFHIKEYSLHGNNLVSFRDVSLKPVFNKQLSINKIKLNNLNNSTAEQVTKYLLKGKVLPNSPYSIEGDITPFAKKLSLNSQIKTEGIGLVDYSSFILPVTGYKIESGELDTDILIKIKENQLDGKNKLVLHHFNIIEADQETAKKLNSTLSMPMNKALDLLRDEHNTITLNVPLSGDINNLSINPNDTINLALGNALKAGSKLYIATALFPYGTIYTLVKMADKKLNAIQLQSVLFQNGKTNLSDTQKDYLNKVAGILKNKKTMRIRLCAKATLSDVEGFIKKQKNSDEALLNLAKRRVISIENYLNKQHKIKPNQLIDCQESIDKEERAKPRVELLI